MVFWALFLIAMFPCGILGILSGYILILKAKKVKSEFGFSVGLFIILCSIGYCFIGFAGLMLIYIVTS
jgi:hypothetical protein